MRIFAIGDLHLPGNSDKPMDVFGSKWVDHFGTISSAWRDMVHDDDVVLLPGDISWAMHIDDAQPDLQAISALPGNKILLRGNHDYWWGSISKLREILPAGMYAIQNDSLTMGDFAIAGSRGWLCPGSTGYTSKDEKIYLRELQRMQLSLESADRSKRIICMTHFPPFTENQANSQLAELFESFGVEHVVFGHLHGHSHNMAFEGVRNGVNYSLCSCDYLNFMPRLVVDG